MHPTKIAATLVLTVLLRLGSPATQAAAPNDNFYNYLQVLRSDFNSAKVGLINGIMKLPAEDAKKFWPLYREYETELAKLATTKAELVAEFVQTHADGTFDDAKAKDVAKRWFKIQRERLDLLEKYHARVEKSLSAIQAGRFLQIENQIGLFIDMAIAGEMPAVGAASK